MRDWNYLVHHPATLTLATDARLCPITGGEDQIWELKIGNTEPPAVAVQTTFGLRAKSCRIFPRFIHVNQPIINPQEFFRSITLHRYYPNYIDLSFKPFNCFNVVLEYWVPDSQSIACRTRIINTSRDKQQLQVEWAELLVPGEDGHRMSVDEIGLTTILTGQTASLAPVLLLIGGTSPGRGPYPSLDFSSTILSHQEVELLWVHTAFADTNASFEHAKQIGSRNWDTEVARLIRINSQRLEVSTGDTDWDDAIYLSQTIAELLQVNLAPKEASPIFLVSRNPDLNFPDYHAEISNNPKTQLSTMGLYYLINFLLPTSPDVVLKLLDKYISNQTSSSDPEDPRVGKRIQNKLLETPLLSTLAWEMNQYPGGLQFLAENYQILLTNFSEWFSETHDRDNDSVPEWDQLVQTGLEDNPLFSFAEKLSIGLDISTVESPDLSSYLYNECQALLLIAEKLGIHDSIPRLNSISINLKSMVESSWSDKDTCFLYLDRDLHISAVAEIIGSRTGSGLIEIHREFDKPVRPLIHLFSAFEVKKPVQIYIQGISTTDSHRVEHIMPAEIHWQLNNGYATSNFCFKKIEQIEVSGLPSNGEMIVRSSGMLGKDITLLLPLWAGIPSDEKAKVLINLAIMNKKYFLSSAGLRTYTQTIQGVDLSEELYTIRPEWMNFIIKGLVRYGERKKASELFTRMMRVLCRSIAQDMTLHPYYHEETGKPLGAANTLFSLAPVGLLLEILGIKIIEPTRVEICSGNPFPWPVTVKYRGLTIVHQEKKSLIIFSDGQNITIDNQQPTKINLDNIET